ncbi:prolyl oligopeptidase family serine peptidase [Tolypothrix sp. NIES-4075]|uniref:prolyl oligopeptidase family serine peptidase n=1 Tax=Tolypothrix sp. NIES-4075 TaxID=2005459 RepID=UPI000B5C8C89
MLANWLWSLRFSFVPWLSTPKLCLVRKRRYYRICHVRGGGKKGEPWYRAGFQQTKPKTWKDFIACAEYLIEQKYTSPACTSRGRCQRRWNLDW